MEPVSRTAWTAARLEPWPLDQQWPRVPVAVLARRRSEPGMCTEGRRKRWRRSRALGRRSRDRQGTGELADCGTRHGRGQHPYQEPFDAQHGAPPVDAPGLPAQLDFYKMPAELGHVPVAEEPLGWDAERRFEHLYPRVSLPFQIVDRVGFGSADLEPNQLFFGDNLHVMRSLPSESINLIYSDPPFFSQKTYNVLFGDQNELRSFRDIWEGGLNGYLVWLNARLYKMKHLEAPNGRHSRPRR